MNMWYVYILTSGRHPGYLYVGFTNNIERRLMKHNAVQSKLATAPYRPLKIAGYVAVCDIDNAKALEQYFKSGSGKAFINKRILEKSTKGGVL